MRIEEEEEEECGQKPWDRSEGYFWVWLYFVHRTFVNV